MIYLIITTCVDNKYGLIGVEDRKKRYIDCIGSVLGFIKNNPLITPIIVENSGKKNTFLDDFGCNILYTNNNLISKEKAINELQDIKDVICTYNIKDDDMIIKLTGRYNTLDDSFLKQAVTTDYDAIIKFFNVSTLEYLENDCVLGLLAVKCKYFKEFNYDFINEFKTSPEYQFAKFIRNTVDPSRIMEVKQLNLECCFGDNLRVLVV
jgi:hypothetical protein